jgi:hypothetical protein
MFIPSRPAAPPRTAWRGPLNAAPALAAALLSALASATGACAVEAAPELDHSEAAVEIPISRPPINLPRWPLPIACSVDRARELVVTDLAVVNDPVRTTCTGASPASCGAWSFGHLMAAMAGTNGHANVSRFARAWLRSWETDQTVNGQSIPARNKIATDILAPWLAASGGRTDALDFSKAPFRLLAIVNRIDLRDDVGYTGVGSAGEGRFVFGVLGADGRQTQFTVILEYNLPAHACGDVTSWADRWHSLGRLSLGSAAYNAALETLTEGFAGFDADPTTPTGSAISQVRTNEFLSSPWELREFELACLWLPIPSPTPPAPRPGTGIWPLPQPDSFGSICHPWLKPATVKQSPADALRDVDLDAPSGAALRAWLADNQDQIRDGSYVIPPRFADGAPFLGSHTQVNGGFDPRHLPAEWEDLRSEIALGSCAGCHERETGTAFLHVSPRRPDAEARISDWLETVELPRREADLCEVVTRRCPPVILPRPPGLPPLMPRVH